MDFIRSVSGTWHIEALDHVDGERSLAACHRVVMVSKRQRERPNPKNPMKICTECPWPERLWK